MEPLKVAGAAGSNAVLALMQVLASASPLESILTFCQIAVAIVTALYIGTKVWNMWSNKKIKDE